MNSQYIGRRAFLRRSGLLIGGAGLLGGIAPNLILNPVYGGTAVIMSSDTDKRISLSNASIARPFSLGTWSIMRVGFRVMMEGSASLTSLTPRFVVGLVSGSTNQVFDASTDNFVGVRTTDATWTITAGAPDLWTVDTGNHKPTKRVGSTWTDGTALTTNTTQYFRSSEQLGEAHAGMIEIAKGSPNYSIRWLRNSGTSIAHTFEQLLTQIVAVTPTLTSCGWEAAQTIATDEVAGTFDHVQFGWDRSEATMEISDIVVCKYAA